MVMFRNIQTKRLKHLSIHSRNAESNIQKKLEFAEAILRLWKMSRSYETEIEQILPFCPNLFELCGKNEEKKDVKEKFGEKFQGDKESEEKNVKVAIDLS